MNSESNFITPEEMQAAILEIQEKLADKGGIKNIFCVACGGSLAGLYPLD